MTASLFGREEVLYRGAAPARSGRQMRQDSVAVLDCDFELVALKGDHPSLYILVWRSFSLALEFKDNVALIRFHDDLRLALPAPY